MVRGNPASRAVALLFSSVPNRHTPEVCRWLHGRGITAAFFLKPEVGRHWQGLGRLRPFDVGITAAGRRGMDAGALEAVRWLGERGPYLRLVPKGSAGLRPDENTIPVAPAAVLRLNLPDEEWRQEVQRVVGVLTGGELILLELPTDSDTSADISKRLDGFFEALSDSGLRIWGLKALLRGEYGR